MTVPRKTTNIIKDFSSGFQLFTVAMYVFGRLVIKKEFEGKEEGMRQDLLQYCKLDTFAKVKILSYLEYI